jgi:phosphate transport system permease protein
MTDLTADQPLRSTRSVADRLGDRVTLVVSLAAALVGLVALVLIAWVLVSRSRLAWDRFGLGFVVHRGLWDPVHNAFGALDFIYGTLITSIGALLIATPIALAIALYLSELAPRSLRTVIGALVEMLAAIPSVVLGLFGILVLGPFVKDYVRPGLGDTLGFVPLFGASSNSTGYGIMTAILVLTIMTVPIIASVSREIFAAVPPDLKEGALALGVTRWEMIRGVMLPTAKPGLVAAVILGFGRAVGEAIAVTQVIGGSLGIHWSLFNTGDTLASRIASQYQGASSNVQTSSLVYLAAILLVISLVVNLLAQLVVRPLGGRPQRRRFGLALFEAFTVQRRGES